MNLATHSGMPSRRFSAAILAGAWPHTDPNDCHTLATVEGGVATGVVGAVTGPADPVVIAGGCLVGGLTDGLKYAVEHAGK